MLFANSRAWDFNKNRTFKREDMEKEVQEATLEVRKQVTEKPSSRSFFPWKYVYSSMDLASRRGTGRGHGETDGNLGMELLTPIMVRPETLLENQDCYWSLWNTCTCVSCRETETRNLCCSGVWWLLQHQCIETTIHGVKIHSHVSIRTQQKPQHNDQNTVASILEEDSWIWVEKQGKPIDFSTLF